MGDRSVEVHPESVLKLGGTFAAAGTGIGEITTHTALPGVESGLNGTAVPGACHFGAGLGALALQILADHLGELGEHSASGAVEYVANDSRNAQDFCNLQE
ncbi:hypothetical protein [Nocardia sp. NPDC006630]|uniref:hypothetical protein n=1 Tax=Nocardia sp. NPDC006630 TaxID=3157181 RepID=UPI0033B3E30F